MNSLQEHLEAERRTLPASAASQTWRSAALATFSARGFPTRRDERWHYTDLKPIENARFPLVPRTPTKETRAAVARLLDAQGFESSGPRLVFIDGHWDAGLSRLAQASGVEISNLADAWDSFVPDRSAPGSAHPLAALNTAFVQQGALVRVARRVAADAPLQLVFVAGGGEQSAPQPRIVIELAEGASATVVQHFLDTPQAAPGWLNLVTEIVQAPSSTLSVYRLQEHGGTQFHTSLLRARLARDARLTAGYVERGGRLVRNDIEVALAEPGAHADLFGLALGTGEQHIDNHVHIEHAAPRTTSIAAFRAIADDRSHCVFCAKVIVRPDAQQIDARQSSNNLLLSPKAAIDTKPELEIYADDVKCAHGATIGELDQEHLFYLRSRGLTEHAARAVLTFAFAQTTLDRIALPALRTRAIRDVAERLPEALGAEGEAR
jgi:Fe-S cluster assembly protein SufD